jgi:hypothetical protein
MSRLQRAAVWLDDYWAQMFALGGAIVLALAGIQSSVQQKDWSWLMSTTYGKNFVIGFLFSTIGGLKIASLSPGQKTMEAEIERLRRELDSRNRGYFKIIEDELYILSEILGFSFTERISLYKHKSEAFVMLGRYSLNHDYKRRGRVIYSDNQGCVGKALRRGRVFIDNLPSNETEYFEVLRKDWDIPLEISQKLVMKSRTLAAHLITNSERNSRAVIVFESAHEQGFDENRVIEVMLNGEEKRISFLLEKIYGIEPSPEYAKGEGY